MPLPTARHTLSHVGATREQGPGAHPCTDPQVRRLFWGRQPADRQIRSRHVRQIRCQDVRGVLETTAQASHTRQKDGDHLG